MTRFERCAGLHGGLLAAFSGQHVFESEEDVHSCERAASPAPSGQLPAPVANVFGAGSRVLTAKSAGIVTKRPFLCKKIIYQYMGCGWQRGFLPWLFLKKLVSNLRRENTQLGRGGVMQKLQPSMGFCMRV